MKICVNCFTLQVQRIKVGKWSVLCRCRHCRFEMYDTVTSIEYKHNLMTDKFIFELVTDSVPLDTEFFNRIEDVLK